jgi:hypothetical protein
MRRPFATVRSKSLLKVYVMIIPHHRVIALAAASLSLTALSAPRPRSFGNPYLERQLRPVAAAGRLERRFVFLDGARRG